MNIFNKIGHWAEQNKFWADIIRTIVIGSLGAILVATYIERLKDRVAYSSEVDKAQLTMKIDAIKDFAEKSYLFTSFAVRYKEAQQLNHHDDSLAQVELRNKYDAYRPAQNQLDLALNGAPDSIFLEQIKNDMLLLINKRDSLNNCLFNFDSVRNRIKNTSYIVETNCLKGLRKFPG